MTKPAPTKPSIEEMIEELNNPVTKPVREGKKVELVEGGYALIDAEDDDKVSKFLWHEHPDGYAVSYSNGKTTLMHRLIMDAPEGEQVDHINHDVTDNRKSNLRLCTNTENSRNRVVQSNNTSGYKGVRFKKDRNKWQAEIKINGKFKWLGYFMTKEEAALAYNTAVVEHYGEYAYLNEIKKGRGRSRKGDGE